MNAQKLGLLVFFAVTSGGLSSGCAGGDKGDDPDELPPEGEGQGDDGGGGEGTDDGDGGEDTGEDTGEDCEETFESYRDADSDGYGDPDEAIEECGTPGSYEPPEGYVSEAGDCQDDDPAVNPDAAEICGNEVDEDCNGVLSECRDLGKYDIREADAFLRGMEMGSCGWNLAVGDLDGDEVQDLVVGCPAIYDGTSWGGAAYVQQGAETFSGYVKTEVGVEAPETGAVVGYTTAVLDLDGDGYDDLAVGSLHVPDSSARGSASVTLGPLSGISDHFDADLLIEGSATRQFFGEGLGSVPDLDGDGRDELAVGATLFEGMAKDSGGVFLFTDLDSSTLEPRDAPIAVLGTEEKGYLGSLVESPGDLDGDGLADLFIAEEWGDGEEAGSGVLWWFSGLTEGTWTTADATGSVQGAATEDDLGAAMDSADLDGDGYLDLVLAAPGSDLPVNLAGSVYVFAGPLSGSLTTSSAVARLGGAEAGEQLGESVAVGGDFDGDGVPDIWAATSRHDNKGGAQEGAAYLFVGPFIGTRDDDDCDALVTGYYKGDEVGTSLLWADDLTGSGGPELVVGASGAGYGSVEAGVVGIFTGW